MKYLKVKNILDFLQEHKDDALIFMRTCDDDLRAVDTIEDFEEQFDTTESVVLQCKKVEQLTAKMLKNLLSSRELESKIYISDYEGFMVEAQHIGYYDGHILISE